MSNRAVFAATKPGHWPQGFAHYANEVRREIGKWYDEDDPRAGWQEAMAEGWRVSKFQIKSV